MSRRTPKETVWLLIRKPILIMSFVLHTHELVEGNKAGQQSKNKP